MQPYVLKGSFDGVISPVTVVGIFILSSELITRFTFPKPRANEHNSRYSCSIQGFPDRGLVFSKNLETFKRQVGLLT